MFQENWDKGNGFRFMFGTFCDIATDPEANEAAAAFIRSQDRRDRRGPGDRPQAHARPTSTPGARCATRATTRPSTATTSTLVSIKENPIAEITPEGVRTADGVVHELDVLVFATGFDAVDGNYRRDGPARPRGRHIDEHWTDGPTSYLGMSKAGFPNMFMILGPNGPFTNLPPSIETQVEWIGELIGHAERRRRADASSRPGGRDGWTADLRGHRRT